MKMSKYTQEDIDFLLANFDEKNPEHVQGILDLLVISTIDLLTINEYKINHQKINEIAQRLVDYMLNNKTKEYNISKDSFVSYDTIKSYFDLAELIMKIDRDQGIKTFDYESNIWRVGFTLKSVQLSEEEARQGKEPIHPDDLIENFTKANYEAFKNTYMKLKTIYVHTETIIGFLHVLKEASKIDAIQLLINKFRLDLGLIELLKEEAHNTEVLIFLNYIKHSSGIDLARDGVTQEQINKTMKAKQKKYQQLLNIPDLKEYSLKDSDYEPITSNYRELSHTDVMHNMTSITQTFREVILNGKNI